MGWSIGIIAALSLYLPLFPSLGGDSGMKELIQQLPPQLTSALGYQSITTGAGYAQSTFFGLIGYLLFSSAAISWGSRAIGADEERGTLELTLAHGVGRTQLLLERWAALAIRLLSLGAVVFLVVLFLNGPSELDLKAGGIAAGSLALCTAALLSGTAAIAGGALFGRRNAALLGVLALPCWATC
ncbi:ABC transporter permease subunit [Leucobacter coleopterorum]|uniref:ABC transporter permease subunit n=1 Tax=Leucobacter coleopterorum TaxID=2714933 RepID=UPI001FCAED64|nr:ABC transporter permease subunit [Leucobacter coleopterorum]